MLRWSMIFLVIAIIAAAFGFGGIASDVAKIAKALLFMFVAVFVVTLVLGLAASRKITS